eukprot:gene51679-52619_t
MRHCVGDLVWVRLYGFPNWPAELLSPDAAPPNGARFRDAVAAANAHARCALTPEVLPSFGVTPVGVVYSHFRAHHHAPRQPSATEEAKG